MLIATCKICHTRKNKNVNKKFADNFYKGIVLEQEIKRPKHEVEISELKCRINELNSSISKLEADLKTKEEVLNSSACEKDMLIVKLQNECENKDVEIARMQDQVRNAKKEIGDLKTAAKKIVDDLQAKLKQNKKELEECRPLKATYLGLLKENIELKKRLDTYNVLKGKPAQMKCNEESKIEQSKPAQTKCNEESKIEQSKPAQMKSNEVSKIEQSKPAQMKCSEESKLEKSKPAQMKCNEESKIEQSKLCKVKPEQAKNLQTILAMISPQHHAVYEDEICKYRDNEGKIEQLVKCQNSFRDGKCVNRVIIDGYEYGDDMDIITNRIKYYTEQKKRSLLNNIV
jgi:hypothetical protein